jgi:hypothetical protein
MAEINPVVNSDNSMQSKTAAIINLLTSIMIPVFIYAPIIAILLAKREIA